MNLNRNQILSIAVAVLAVLMTSTAQLTDIFGATLAKTIISIAGLANGVMSSVLAIITSQSGMVKDVAAMPGIDSIKVNAQANSTLANIAVGSGVNKVTPTAKDTEAVILAAGVRT